MRNSVGDEGEEWRAQTRGCLRIIVVILIQRLELNESLVKAKTDTGHLAPWPRLAPGVRVTLTLTLNPR